MGFIAPLWFLLGAAAAVPLLVHLLRRRSGATVDFPAARYLARAEREHSRSIRLRNLLLMLLRVLAILLLAAAAARPVGRLLASAGGGHAPTALAIVLDNSLSTSVIEDGRPVLDALREAARAVVEEAGADDRLYLVTADGRLRTGSRESALEALTDIAPLHGAGDLAAAVRRAGAAVAEDGGHEPRLVVLTDGQRTAWRAAVELPDDVPVIVAGLGTPAPPNRAVTLARPRPARWTPSGALEIRVHARDSTALRVLLSPPGRPPRTIARQLAAPDEALLVRATPADTGLLAGQVELDGDELPGDDVRHFAVWAGPAPRVNVLPGAGPFLRSALESVGEGGAVQPGDGIRVLSADEIGTWRGAMLIVAPSAPARLGAANAAMARAGVPWRFGAPAQAGTTRGDSLLPALRVQQRYALTAAAAMSQADTLVTVNGTPWAVAGAANGTRYVVIASPIEPDATELPVRAAFVPWIAALVTGLAGPGGAVVDAAPGQLVRRPAAGDSLVAADGTASPLTAGSFRAPSVPGVYVLRQQGRVAGAVVVNVEESESVMDRMQVEDVAARIRGPQVETAPVGSALARRAYAAAGTRSLVGPVLAAALLVLGLEALLTGVRARGTA